MQSLVFKDLWVYFKKNERERERENFVLSAGLLADGCPSLGRAEPRQGPTAPSLCVARAQELAHLPLPSQVPCQALHCQQAGFLFGRFKLSISHL